MSSLLTVWLYYITTKSRRGLALFPAPTKGSCQKHKTCSNCCVPHGIHYLIHNFLCYANNVCLFSWMSRFSATLPLIMQQVHIFFQIFYQLWHYNFSPSKMISCSCCFWRIRGCNSPPCGVFFNWSLWMQAFVQVSSVPSCACIHWSLHGLDIILVQPVVSSFWQACNQIATSWRLNSQVLNHSWKNSSSIRSIWFG